MADNSPLFEFVPAELLPAEAAPDVSVPAESVPADSRADLPAASSADRSDNSDATTKPPLIHGLQGFTDAGHAVRLSTEHLRQTLDAQLVARFDIDKLLDYRSRRPTMTFRDNKFAEYQEPALDLWALYDGDALIAYLLAGLEPDLYWERFVADVASLIAQLDIGTTIGLSAIPMAVPHTRPLGLTAHSADRALIAKHSMWPGELQIPSSASSLLEYRLGEWKLPAVGYSAHVPHYLAQMDYPEAALLLLETISDDAQINLPLAKLRDAAARVREQISSHVTGNTEVEEIVSALERQHDAMIAAQEQQTALLGGNAIPTGDEIGAEFERFLASQTDDDTIDPPNPDIYKPDIDRPDVNGPDNPDEN